MDSESEVWLEYGDCSELVRVAALGDGLYRICEAPMWEGPTYGDTVRATQLSRGVLSIESVHCQSEFQCASWLYSERRLESNETKRVLERIVESGGYWQRDLGGLLRVFFNPKIYDPRPEFALNRVGPALENFIEKYFHKNWVHDFGTSDRVVSAYLDEASSELLAQCVLDLEWALQRDDTALDSQLSSMDCGYSPESDGLSNREWLSKVLQEFRRHL